LTDEGLVIATPTAHLFHRSQSDVIFIWPNVANDAKRRPRCSVGYRTDKGPVISRRVFPSPRVAPAVTARRSCILNQSSSNGG